MENSVIIISPNGDYHMVETGNNGHAIKLIEYYENNNLYYDKMNAVYIPSQEFAFALSNMGYIIFLLESNVTALFLSDKNLFTIKQYNALLKNNNQIKEALQNNIVIFNEELLSGINSIDDKYNFLLDYINSKIYKENVVSKCVK